MCIFHGPREGIYFRAKSVCRMVGVACKDKVIGKMVKRGRISNILCLDIAQHIFYGGIVPEK